MIDHKDSAELEMEKEQSLADKNVKNVAYQILLSIEQNNLRFCLKHSFTMLCELLTEKLNSKYYFQLYKSIFDELKKIEVFMQEEIDRGRLPEEIYESVLQCRLVIPRLYLAILSGGLYIKNEPKKWREIATELLELSKESQNPLRGVFTRYFLLQIMRDKLPEKDNIYVKEEGGTFKETLYFLLQNFVFRGTFFCIFYKSYIEI